MRQQSRGPGVTSHGKDRFFNVNVKLMPTAEMFTLKNIHNDMKISEMKSYAEFVTGIPTDIQRIRYLDEGDLLDTTTVRSNDIVGGAQLHMNVWSEWTKLIEAVVANDIDWVFKLGVTLETDYRTPHLDYLLPSKRKQWLSNRGRVALYISAHRGHQRLCERLIAQGADVNGETVMGRTALHVASSMGHGSILDMLLEYGGNIDAEDKLGENALTIANKFGHKGCERHLFLFRWQERAKQIRTQVYVPMFAHQHFDSANPVWLKGEHAQVYYTQILPPGEYEGTGLSAPKRPGWTMAGKSEIERLRAARLVESDESSEYETDDDEEDDRSTRFPRIGDNQLAAIREENGSRSQGSANSAHGRTKSIAFSKTKKKKKKKSGFDDWLAKKEAEDLIRITAKREENKKKREEAENKRKDEALKDAMKETSYESWLAEQEAQNKKGKKDGKGGPAGAAGGGAATGAGAGSGGKTTKEVIRNLLIRKQAEGGYHGLPTEIWMAERDPKLFNQIKVHGNLLLEHYN